jgi:hypothetical protein
MLVQEWILPHVLNVDDCNEGKSYWKHQPVKHELAYWHIGGKPSIPIVKVFKQLRICVEVIKFHGHHYNQ